MRINQYFEFYILIIRDSGNWSLDIFCKYKRLCNQRYYRIFLGKSLSCQGLTSYAKKYPTYKKSNGRYIWKSTFMWRHK